MAAATTIAPTPEEEKKWKFRIRKAFNLFDTERKGHIVHLEVGSVMRYLGYFPSERDIVEKILPAMKGDDPTEFVLYDRFEDYMLDVMANEDYLPASDSGLLAAFRVLDEEKKGYIDVGRLTDLLTKKGIPFRPKELNEAVNSIYSPTYTSEFLTKAQDSIHQNRVYYEDYVTMFSKSVDVILLEASNTTVDDSKS